MKKDYRHHLLELTIGRNKKDINYEKSKINFIITIAIILLLASCVKKVEQRNLSMTTPEAVGMSSERLDRLNQAMQKEVDKGNTAGITTMIARHGKIVHFETYGYQDIESNIPCTLQDKFIIECPKFVIN